MTPKQVIYAWHRAFVARDVDGLCALYADDALVHQVAEAPHKGLSAIREGFQNFFKNFPDETTTILNVFEDGEWGMWEWKGGSPSRTPAGMDPEALHGCGFFHVKNGKIVFQRGYWDMLTFLKAHGLKPS